VLEEIKGRIGAVHFKDFKNRIQAKEEWLNPVILGRGMAPLSDGAKWLKENIEEPMWCIAEQDFADVPPKEAALENAGFLKANL
jgi:sugar phosphate isomerase/epimerase